MFPFTGDAICVDVVEDNGRTQRFHASKDLLQTIKFFDTSLSIDSAEPCRLMLPQGCSIEAVIGIFGRLATDPARCFDWGKPTVNFVVQVIRLADMLLVGSCLECELRSLLLRSTTNINGVEELRQLCASVVLPTWVNRLAGLADEDDAVNIAASVSVDMLKGLMLGLCTNDSIASSLALENVLAQCAGNAALLSRIADCMSEILAAQRHLTKKGHGCPSGGTFSKGTSSFSELVAGFVHVHPEYGMQMMKALLRAHASIRIQGNEGLETLYAETFSDFCLAVGGDALPEALSLILDTDSFYIFRVPTGLCAAFRGASLAVQLDASDVFTTSLWARCPYPGDMALPNDDDRGIVTAFVQELLPQLLPDAQAALYCKLSRRIEAGTQILIAFAEDLISTQVFMGSCMEVQLRMLEDLSYWPACIEPFVHTVHKQPRRIICTKLLPSIHKRPFSVQRLVLKELFGVTFEWAVAERAVRCLRSRLCGRRKHFGCVRKP